MRFAAFLSVLLALLHTTLAAEQPLPFAQRGYYMTFMRMPALGLGQWKEMVDCAREDGANTLILWMAGAFRSKKFPITWQYNRDHQNVQNNFAPDLIDYAHRRKVRILLGFTPFAYDGVNQYPLEHPELKAIQKNGQPATLWGMHSWGYNLCPSQPGSQRFMLEYIREMLFDFYPKADGVLIESSDYAICYCPNCREKFFAKEFTFVRKISEDIWARTPAAQIVVYPHYFTGRPVPGFDVAGAKEPFDPRWTLFFTPHSAHIDPELLDRAKTSIFWNDGLTLGSPAKIREGARLAQQNRLTGYIPSCEPFTCPTGPPSNPGPRMKPFHFGWLKAGEMPLRELLLRVNRIAYREFSANPELSQAAFESTLGKEIFANSASAGAVKDLLDLQSIFSFEADWLKPSPMLEPKRLTERARRENWDQTRWKPYRERLDRVRQIEQRYRSASNPAEKEMARIAGYITSFWPSDPQSLP